MMLEMCMRSVGLGQGPWDEDISRGLAICHALESAVRSGTVPPQLVRATGALRKKGEELRGRDAAAEGNAVVRLAELISGCTIVRPDQRMDLGKIKTELDDILTDIMSLSPYAAKPKSCTVCNHRSFRVVWMKDYLHREHQMSSSCPFAIGKPSDFRVSTQVCDDLQVVRKEFVKEWNATVKFEDEDDMAADEDDMAADKMRDFLRGSPLMLSTRLRAATITFVRCPSWRRGSIAPRFLSSTHLQQD
jgi:hypothetical protein